MMLALIVAVVAVSVTFHPGSAKASNVDSMMQLVASIVVRVCHVFFVLIVSISVNSHIC